MSIGEIVAKFDWSQSDNFLTKPHLIGYFPVGFTMEIVSTSSRCDFSRIMP